MSGEGKPREAVAASAVTPKQGRRAVAVLVVVLLILCSLPFLFLRPPVAVFTIYVIGLFVSVLLYVLGAWRGGRRRTLSEMIEVTLRRANVQIQSAVFRARMVATLILANISVFIAWPSMLTAVGINSLRARRGKIGSFETRLRSFLELYPPHVLLLGVNLGTALIVSILHDAAGLATSTGRWAHWALIASTLAWAAAAIVAPQAFIASLRRSEGNTYLRFLALGFALMGVFGVGLTALAGAGKWMDLFSVSATVKEIMAFQKAFDQPGGVDLLGLTRALAGVLFYLLIARGALDFNGFERDRSDLLALAQLWNRAGKPEKALEYLRKLTVVDSEILAVRAITLLGLGQIKEAIGATKEVMRLGESAGWYAQADPYPELVGIAPLYTDEKTGQDLVSQWIESAGEDADVCLAMVPIIRRHGRPFVEQLLSANGGSQRYPISWAWMLGLFGTSSAEQAEATRLLEENRRVEGLVGFLAVLLLLWDRVDANGGASEMGELVDELSVRLSEITSMQRRRGAYFHLLFTQQFAQQHNDDLYRRVLPLVMDLEAHFPTDQTSLLITETVRAGVSEGLKQAARAEEEP